MIHLNSPADRRTGRLRAEQAFHDWQAQARADHFQTRPEQLRFTDKDYLDHETWVRPAMTWLGDLRGRRVLDFGCGHGMAGVVMARHGAKVTALDLSGGYLREARARATANQVPLTEVQADGEFLPFADHCFDAIWGNAILHHLDMARAGKEIHRVLKPGGRAVFCEPWGENRILEWARRKMSYPGKERTADEAPLRLHQVRQLQTSFSSVEVEGQQLMSMAGRVLGGGPWQGRLARWDDCLLKRWPSLVHWCRYVVVRLRP